MTDIRDEVRTALKRIVENLKSVAQRTPNAPIESDDFNSLLERSKKAFPNLSTIQEMKGIDGGSTLGSVLLKISILQGAVEADWAQRISDANAEEVKRRRPQGGFIRPR